MPNTLTVIFRRDPSRDWHRGEIQFEGYEIVWPDGRPVAIGLDAFCSYGQRLLGLGRHLRGCSERLMDLICIPLHDREAHLTKLPGARVRRLFLKRTGREGRIHFIDGTPTEATFEIGRDEQRVVQWIGLAQLTDGEGQWFDLAARPVEPTVTAPVGDCAPVMTRV